MNLKPIIPLLISTLFVNASYGKEHQPGDENQVADKIIAEQRQMLEKNTRAKGYGPQSPRDIDAKAGENRIMFKPAPAYQAMNLCNIHFHKNAEHKGGEFTRYAGNGDGHGYLSGYQYSGELSEAELAPVEQKICPSPHGNLHAGDTIEVHYVFSTAHITPGPTLDSCFNDAAKNPQLRVEAQVFVLVNDKAAGDFMKLTKHRKVNGLHQAVSMPTDTGTAVEYAGSTTGPGYNEVGSPYQVTWGVRPNVAKVNIDSVGKWCEGNVFNEDHAHGVRNLVINPDLLSPIKP